MAGRRRPGANYRPYCGSISLWGGGHWLTAAEVIYVGLHLGLIFLALVTLKTGSGPGTGPTRGPQDSPDRGTQSEGMGDADRHALYPRFPHAFGADGTSGV